MGNKTIDKYHVHRWLTAAVALPIVAMIIAMGPGWLLLALVLLVTAGGLLELSGLLLAGTKDWLRMLTWSMGVKY